MGPQASKSCDIGVGVKDLQYMYVARQKCMSTNMQKSLNVHVHVC